MRVTVRLFARLRDIAGAGEMARDVVNERLVFTEALDEGLDLGKGFGVFPVVGRVALRGRTAQKLHERFVLRPGLVVGQKSRNPLAGGDHVGFVQKGLAKFERLLRDEIFFDLSCHNQLAPPGAGFMPGARWCRNKP